MLILGCATAAGAQPIDADAGIPPAAPIAPGSVDMAPTIGPEPVPVVSRPPTAPDELEIVDDELALKGPLDDDALEAMLQDTPDVATEAEKISLYGFADFGARKFIIPDRSSWLLTVPGKSTFLLRNLNLYLRARPAARWTSLVEIRFSFLPNGAQSTELSLGEQPASTQYRDYVDPASTITIGGTAIQRAWIEYAVTPKLQIRGGRWLSPYGVWNIDHGSPTVLGARRPFLVGSESIPEAQTGLQLLGKAELQDYRLPEIQVHGSRAS